MLLNRPERYPDESISSYLYRVAEVNYRSFSILTASIGITRAEWLKNMFSDEQLTDIAFHLNQTKVICFREPTIFIEIC